MCRYLSYEMWQELLSLLPDRVTHDRSGLGMITYLGRREGSRSRKIDNTGLRKGGIRNKEIKDIKKHIKSQGIGGNSKKSRASPFRIVILSTGAMLIFSVMLLI